MVRLGGRRVRRVLGGSAVVVAGAGLLLGMGVQDGYPASRPQLLSGSAWLASRGAGQMTLLDGSSAEVAAQVRVAKPGDRFDVVQQGSIGYVVNRSSGTLRRVDGATFEVSAPTSPMPGAGDGLQAFAGAGALYALDSQRGVLMSVDARTLAPRGTPVPLATQISGQGAALDGAGRLWVLDTVTGDLVWVEHGRRHTRRGVASPGVGRLVLADGAPVVVDAARRGAFVLDPDDGGTRAGVALDLRGTDEVQLSGSPHHSRIYLAVSRGVLTICDVAGGGCANAVPIGQAGVADLGVPVESGGRVFVPDYASGKVWIIDLGQSRVVAQPQVLDPRTRFQLLTRDGVVFFNDPDSEHAGVIRLDGGVRRVAKYDPKDPDKGLSYPGSARNPSPSPTPSTPSPGPRQPPSPQPSPPAPPPPASRAPLPPRPPKSSKPSAPPDRTVRISVSKTVAAVNEDVTFQVTADAGPPPTSARWDFGDGQSNEGLLATHHWSAAKTYQVSVRVTFPDGRVATASLGINIVAQPPPPVVLPNVLGMTSATATSTLTGLGLSVTTRQAASNTVPAGVVMAQAPGAGTSVPAGSQVTITVSSGKRPPFLLINQASAAAWSTGAGTIPFGGSDGDDRGFALIRPAGSYLLEDGSAPQYLEMHPQWVNFGWINGVYTLANPIMAGDHFRARIGFMKTCCNVSVGDADFVVRVRRSGTWTEVGRKHDIGSDGVLYDLDFDLSGMQGATAIMLRVEAGASSSQDWASWIRPRIEG